MTQPSGAAWCSRYPTSTATEDLIEPFRSNTRRFIGALREAGARVVIDATLRPKERGYLMNGAWRIAREHVDPVSIEAFPGVDIDWTCGGDPVKARAATAAMVETYGIAFKPSLTSWHYEGRAIDMTIVWSGTLKIRLATGARTGISAEPHSGMNRELWAAGAGYGVHKLPSDAPHWSDDGH